jgi:hypothetical protein
MESLQADVESFGIQTLIVNPGFFRRATADPAIG